MAPEIASTLASARAIEAGPAREILAEMPSPVAVAAGGDGEVSAAHIGAIHEALKSSQMLSAFVSHVIRWELRGGEINLFFPHEQRSLSEMMSREAMERLRTTLQQVVGRPLRVCVKLEAGRATAGRGAELRARFERDPIVRAMLEKFGGQISRVKRPGEE
jgi:hypothetical protein